MVGRVKSVKRRKEMKMREKLKGGEGLGRLMKVE